MVSYHNTFGPVLADDFVPAHGGMISTVEWWGSAATSTSWELVFNTNSPANQPAIDNPFSGGVVKWIVNAAGVPDIPGQPEIYHFSADVVGLPPMYVNAGTEYWLTVANFSPGWEWALALAGPTVGSEAFNVQQSVNALSLCGDGGPHCGPWVDIHTDAAFRLTAVPEPGTLVLIGVGLLALRFARRR